MYLPCIMIFTLHWSLRLAFTLHWDLRLALRFSPCFEIVDLHWNLRPTLRTLSYIEYLPCIEIFDLNWYLCLALRSSSCIEIFTLHSSSGNLFCTLSYKCCESPTLLEFSVINVLHLDFTHCLTYVWFFNSLHWLWFLRHPIILSSWSTSKPWDLAIWAKSL